MKRSLRNTTLYLRGIPRDIVRRLKAQAALRGMTLNALVTETLSRMAGEDHLEALKPLEPDMSWYEAHNESSCSSIAASTLQSSTAACWTTILTSARLRPACSERLACATCSCHCALNASARCACGLPESSGSDAALSVRVAVQSSRPGARTAISSTGSLRTCTAPKESLLWSCPIVSDSTQAHCGPARSRIVGGPQAACGRQMTLSSTRGLPSTTRANESGERSRLR